MSEAGKKKKTPDDTRGKVTLELTQDSKDSRGLEVM